MIVSVVALPQFVSRTHKTYIMELQMFKKAMPFVSVWWLVLLCGCAARMSPESGSPALIAADWYVDQSGAVIVPFDVDRDLSNDAADADSDLEESRAMSQREAIAIACGHFTIVGMEVQPTGQISALEFAAIAGLSMDEGESFMCVAIIVDRAAAEVIIDYGIEGEECCAMKVQMLNGVMRMSCSGDCDNGEVCALESTMTGDITEFTCACPKVP